MTARIKPPRELAARKLCKAEGQPENITFEGQPMWMSYLDAVDIVLEAVLPPEEFERLRRLGP